jgi:hypothetical protein
MRMPPYRTMQANHCEWTCDKGDTCDPKSDPIVAFARGSLSKCPVAMCVAPRDGCVAADPVYSTTGDGRCCQANQCEYVCTTKPATEPATTVAATTEAPKKPCKQLSGLPVAHGLSVAGEGDNYCNSCTCNDGVLMCTKIGCDLCKKPNRRVCGTGLKCRSPDGKCVDKCEGMANACDKSSVCKLGECLPIGGGCEQQVFPYNLLANKEGCPIPGCTAPPHQGCKLAAAKFSVSAEGLCCQVRLRAPALRCGPCAGGAKFVFFTRPHFV